MRPVDGAAFASGPIDVAAKAPEGAHLELDGKAAEGAQVEQPFPGVLHAKLAAEPGEHVVALVWPGGRAQVRVFVGDNPPDGFKPFHTHPPPDGIDCAQCHGLSRRGRFRFQGDCFACHTDEQFTAKHPHAKHVLEQCGMCHNAHGSTADALQLYPRETACRQCHSL
ncbi:MAG: hypothetical protein H6509_06105 [Bryobacterales bacterium]|nr:hypothetical protein [Acidobacteriota bacterium]MCB9384168.1 hypothetical protein [Bryobacterales bacterium]